MELNVLLTTNDLCQLFQVNRSTIHRWVRGGNLPKPIMLGERSPRWKKDQLDSYLTIDVSKEAA